MGPSLDKLAQLETIEPVERRRRQQASREPCLTLLFHPDASRVGERRRLFSAGAQERVAVSRLEPVFELPDGTATAPLAEPCLSRRPIWFSNVGGGAVLLMPDPEGSEVRLGDTVLATPTEVSAQDLRQGVTLVLARRLAFLLHKVAPPQPRAPNLGLVGESDVLEELRRGIVAMATPTVPILLTGETGAGKELVARALHGLGPRANGPFVAVNVAAIPDSTAASELFGHAAGAFTGAKGHRAGYFEQANKGTLFLDEIGAASPDLQAMFLRTLENNEIQRVGGSGAKEVVDVRVIAATDADLDLAVRQGGFRAPLFHRLSACTVHVPPLRHRRDDIGRLLMHFVREELTSLELGNKLEVRAGGEPPWLPADVVARAASLPWPGNVRQLRHWARRLALCNAERAVVQPAAGLWAGLEAELVETQGPDATPVQCTTHRSPGELTEDDILAALRQHKWRIKAAAAALGISRSSLYARIKDSGTIRKAKEISQEELIRSQADCDGDLDAMAEQLHVSKRGLKLRMSDLGLL